MKGRSRKFLPDVMFEEGPGKREGVRWEVGVSLAKEQSEEREL